MPQSVANSFLEWIKKTDYELVITHPRGYELSSQFTQNCNIEYEQEKAFENADFIYTKNWSSYIHYGEILSTDENWMITQKKMELTNDAYFMHCLPVRRNVVISDDALDSDHSVVVQQAGNRLFTAQAVLKQILKGIQ